MNKSQSINQGNEGGFAPNSSFNVPNNSNLGFKSTPGGTKVSSIHKTIPSSNPLRTASPDFFARNEKLVFTNSPIDNFQYINNASVVDRNPQESIQNPQSIKGYSSFVENPSPNSKSYTIKTSGPDVMRNSHDNLLISSLNQEINRLQQANFDLRNKLSQTSTLQIIDDSSTSKNGQYQILRNDNEKLMRQNSQLRTIVTTQSLSLKDLVEKIKVYEHNVAVLSTQLNRSSGFLKSRSQENDHLQSQLGSFHLILQERDTLQREVQMLNENLKIKIRELEELRSRYPQNNSQALQSRILKLQHQLQNTNAANDDYQRNMEQMVGALREADEKQGLFAVEIQRLNEILNMKNDEIDRIRRDCQQEINEILFKNENQMNELNAQNIEIDKLKSQLDQTQSDGYNLQLMQSWVMENQSQTAHLLVEINRLNEVLRKKNEEKNREAEELRSLLISQAQKTYEPIQVVAAPMPSNVSEDSRHLYVQIEKLSNLLKTQAQEHEEYQRSSLREIEQMQKLLAERHSQEQSFSIEQSVRQEHNFSEDVNNLNEKLKFEAKKNRDLTDAIEKLKVELQRINVNLKKTTNDFHEQKKKNQQFEGQIIDFNKTIRTSKRDYQQLAEDKQIESAHLNKTINSLRDEVAKLQKENQSLRDSIANYIKEFETKKQERQRIVSRQKDQLIQEQVNYHRKYEEAARQYEIMKEKENSFQERIKQIEQEISSQSVELESSQMDVLSLNSQLEQLNREYEDAVGDLTYTTENLRSDLRSAEQTIEELKKRNEELEDLQPAIREGKRDLEQKLNEQVHEIERLERHVAHLKHENEELRGRYDEAINSKSQIRHTPKEIIKEVIVERIKEVQKKEQPKMLIKQPVENSDEIRKFYEQQESDLKAQLYEMEDEINKKNYYINELESKLQNVKVQRPQPQYTFTTQNVDNRKLIEERDYLSNELKKAMKAYSQIKQQYRNREFEFVQEIEKLKENYEISFKQSIETHLKELLSEHQRQKGEIIDDYEYKIRSVRQESESKDHELQIWKQRILKIQKFRADELQEVQKQLENLRSIQITHKNFTNAEASAERTLYESSLFQMEGKIKDMRQELELATQENMEIKMSYSQKIQELDVLQSKLRNFESSNRPSQSEELQNIIDSQKRQIMNLKETNLQIDYEKQALSSQISSLKNTIDSLKSELHQIFEILQERNSEIEKLTFDIQQIKRQRDELRNSFNNSQSQTLDNSNPNYLTQELLEMTKSRDYYKNQVQKNQGELVKKSQELVDAIQEISVLKAKYNESISQIHGIESRALENLKNEQVVFQ